MTPPRFVATIGGICLHDPARGLRQRDVIGAEVGMPGNPMMITGGGQHGGAAGRMIYEPGVMVIPVDVFATSGSTTQQREASFRDNLAWLVQTVVGGELRCDLQYGTGDIRRSRVVCEQLIQIEEIIEGQRYGVPVTWLETWRETEDREQVFPSLSDPDFLDLTEFAGSTGPLCDWVIRADGPSDPFEVIPQDTRLGAHAAWSMAYDVEIPNGEWVEIDTETATITASDNDLIDYSALRHPGNSGYLLEIPPGPAGGSPRVKVTGAPASLTFTGKRQWLAP